MKKSMRVSILLVVVFLPLIIVGTNTNLVTAVSDIVAEDFTSTVYRDSTNTNVTDWGSGLVELPLDIHNITKDAFGLNYNKIWASGDFVYTLSEFYWIQSLNVSDPTNVISCDFWSGISYPTDVWISGDYAYVSCLWDPDTFDALIQVVNITNPYDMVTIGNGTATNMEQAMDICGAGMYVYVSSVNYIFTFNVNDPTSPTLVDSMYLGDVYDIATSDGYLYLLLGTALAVYDLSTPSAPSYHGFCNLGVSGSNIIVEDDYAYIGYANGMKIVSLSDPANPVVEATCGSINEVDGISTDGNYAYLNVGYGGLSVFNITTPSAPLHHYTFDLYQCQAVCIQGNYAYVTYKDSPLNTYFGIWDIGNIGDYTENAQAQSKVVYTSSTYSNISGSVLRVNQTVPVGTSITYFLSADDGLHWEEVTPNLYHVFVYPGKDLKWRAQLSTSDGTATPIIYSLNITVNTKLYPVTLASPIGDVHISDNTPTLSWSSISEASEYIVQLDTSPTFDSENFRNATTTETEYTPTTPLIDGRWYWQIIAIDSEGQPGWVSLTESVVVDTTGPEWDEEPTDQICELGMPFTYDLDASDISGIGYWWVNDTIKFDISADGVISNKTNIGVGVYGLEIRVYDSLDNYISESITLTVQETTPSDTTTTTTSTSTMFPLSGLMLIGGAGVVIVIGGILILKRGRMK